MQTVHCAIHKETDVYVASAHGRSVAIGLGFDPVNRTRIVIVILELARNLLLHAGGGNVEIAAITRANQRGILIEASDTGPGIANIALALRDGYSTTKTLGVGLPGVKRFADEFDISSKLGVGTTVRVIKWLVKPSFVERSRA